MSKRAIIAVDIQNDYFPGGKYELAGMEKAADNAARVIRAARERGDRVIHIQHVFEGPEAPFFVPNTEGVKTNPAASVKLV